MTAAQHRARAKFLRESGHVTSRERMDEIVAQWVGPAGRCESA